MCDQLTAGLRRFGADAEVRPGRPAAPYRLAGEPPVAAVAPRDEAAVAAVIATAREQRWTVVPRGGGSRDRWGGPVVRGPVIVLETRLLQGIVAHEPGDLTIRVRPGTTLSSIHQALKPHGQALACEVPTARPSTVGGAIAADAWGPSRMGLGGPRDLMLGLRAVDGAARAFAAGGHVVKNVSGLDIGKLFIGSFGSIGVITELSLKVRPVPPCQAFWAGVFAVPATAWSAANRISGGPFHPIGLTLSERAHGARLAVCIEGGEAAVADQLKRMSAVAGGGTELSPAEAQRAWDADREVEPAADVALAARCEVPEGELEPLAREAAGLPYALRRVAWPGLGVLWCIVDGAVAEALGPAESLALIGRLRAMAAARGGRVVVAACPNEIRADAEPFGDPGPLLPWYRAIKQRFDPDGILAPGRFVGGL